MAEAIVQFEQMAEFDSGNPDHIEGWGNLYLSQTDVPPEERRAKASAVWERLLINRAEDPVTIVRLATLFRQAELAGPSSGAVSVSHRQRLPPIRSIASTSANICINYNEQTKPSRSGTVSLPMIAGRSRISFGSRKYLSDLSRTKQPSPRCARLVIWTQNPLNEFVLQPCCETRRITAERFRTKIRSKIRLKLRLRMKPTLSGYHRSPATTGSRRRRS